MLGFLVLLVSSAFNFRLYHSHYFVILRATGFACLYLAHLRGNRSNYLVILNGVSIANAVEGANGNGRTVVYSFSKDNDKNFNRLYLSRFFYLFGFCGCLLSINATASAYIFNSL